MAKKKKILRRIETVTLTQKITQTMKLMATSFLERNRGPRSVVGAYYRALADFMQEIVVPLKDQQSGQTFPMLGGGGPSQEEHALLVMVTADKGLAGGFTSTMGKGIGKHYRDFKEKYKEVTLLPLGKRGNRYCHRHNIPYLDKFPRLGEKEFSKGELVDFLEKSFLAGHYTSIFFLYQSRSVGASAETFSVVPLLPIALEAQKPLEEKSLKPLMEPGYGALLARFLPLWIKVQVYHFLAESQAAEQRARMMTMHQASENAKSLLKSIKHSYNRQRQAAITQEINEMNAARLPTHQ